MFLRNATAYGVSPRMRVDLVLSNLVGWAMTTGQVRIMSDGSPWRPLVHIRDIAAAMVAALAAPRAAIHNQAFNVGRDGDNFQVRDIAAIVRATVPGATDHLRRQRRAGPPQLSRRLHQDPHASSRAFRPSGRSSAARAKPTTPSARRASIRRSSKGASTFASSS